MKTKMTIAILMLSAISQARADTMISYEAVDSFLATYVKDAEKILYPIVGGHQVQCQQYQQGSGQVGYADPACNRAAIVMSVVTQIRQQLQQQVQIKQQQQPQHAIDCP